jgi:ribosomal protein S18 acetylase RimI-like enzyme
MMEIVKLKSEQFAIASDRLAAAFGQDPLVTSFLPDEKAAKQLALKKMSQALLNFGQSYDHLYTTADQPKGVAIWLPPEAGSVNLSLLWQIARSGLLAVPFYIRWDRIGDFLAFLGTELRVHEATASEPHWYLAMLGVSPECQGQGIGGQLLQPVLGEADRTQMPCYLETSTAAAVRFYQRNGFEIVHHGTFSDREYWAMKRQPQGA